MQLISPNSILINNHLKLYAICNKEHIPLEAIKVMFSFAEWTKNRNDDQIINMVKNSDLIMLCHIEGIPVGFVRCLTDWTFRAFIEDLIVNPDYYGRGIGRAIINFLEKTLSEGGGVRIELSSTKLAFWEKLGYEPKTSTTHFIKRLVT
jgi:GNAT superfamily N-acetyltransferase